MVSHQHPGVNYPACLFTRFSKAFQKKSPILIIPKYRRTTIPSRHHMVKCPLKFQSNASCHAVCLITPNKIPQHKNERKCTLTPISTWCELRGRLPIPPLHTFHQIRLRGLNEKKIMVSHQYPDVNYPARLFTRFSKAFQKKTPIVIVHKYRRTTIPSCHHMVKCPLKFQSKASCHAFCLITPNKILQHKNERKCTLTPSFFALTCSCSFFNLPTKREFSLIRAAGCACSGSPIPPAEISDRKSILAANTSTTIPPAKQKTISLGADVGAGRFPFRV